MTLQKTIFLLILGMDAICGLSSLKAEAFCPPQSWLQIDFIAGIVKNCPVSAPLVTTASFSDALPGAIGQPGTQVVLGNGPVRMGWQEGFQVNAGSWLTTSPRFGIDGGYFLLPKLSKQESVATTGEPGSVNFAVPIFDVTGVFGLNGVPGETVFLLPGPLFGAPGFEGRFDLRLSTQFQGAETNGLFQCGRWGCFQVDVSGGFRWLQLRESLILKGASESISDVSGFYFFRDDFSTVNNFFGGQLGLKLHYASNEWELQGGAKVGAGALDQEIDINGYSQTYSGNLFFLTHNTAGVTLPGGVFAEPTNSGNYKKREVAALVEASFRGTCYVTSNIKLSLGYRFLWLNKIARPGDQIDRRINTTLTALGNASRETVGTGPGPIAFGSPGPAPAPEGPNAPKFNAKTSNFWMQALCIGIEIDF